MPSEAELNAQIAHLPEDQQRVLRCRLGLDGNGQKTTAEAAKALGMTVEEYTTIETAAFVAVRGAGRV
jgi:DNA-directed RNA polymerase sigma subunit (sigma70/sigma32)